MLDNIIAFPAQPRTLRSHPDNLGLQPGDPVRVLGGRLQGQTGTIMKREANTQTGRLYFAVLVGHVMLIAHPDRIEPVTTPETPRLS